MKKWTRPIALMLAVVMTFSIAAYGRLQNGNNLTYAQLNQADANSFEEVSSIDAAINSLTQSSGNVKYSVTGTSAQDCEHSPLIVLPGIGQSEVYRLDENGNRAKGDEGKIMCFNTDPFKDLITPALKMLLTQKDNGFTEALYNAMGEAISANYVNKQGVMPNGVEIIRHNYPLANFPANEKADFYKRLPLERYTDLVGEDHVYFFPFNPLGEPYVAAAELDTFVQNVLAQTGHTKVNFLVLSLGGTILTAYLDDYADKGQVDKIINVVAALNGSQLVADLFKREFDLSDEKLYNEFFPSFLEGSTGYLANLAIRLFPKQVLYDTLTSVMVQLLQTSLINSPSMWAVVPYDEYDALAARYLSGPDYATLKAKTDKYHAAQGNLATIMTGLVNDGVKIYNIGAYGLAFGSQKSAYAFFGLVASAKTTNSDAIIQSSSTTMGGTFADIGKTFSSSYVQQNTRCTNPNHNHISPDRTADLSTALFPDRTWVYYQQHHELDANDAALNLIMELLMNNGQLTVYSNARFPQFNGERDTKKIRRDLLPKAAQVDQSQLSAEDKAELNAAIAQAQAVLDSAIANPQESDAATLRLQKILAKLGLATYKEESKLSTVGTKISKFLSDTASKYIGARGYSDDKNVKAVRNENIGNLAG